MAGTQNIGESSDNPVAINVTAMVDVIFCLCLFFMCSFHFKQLEGKIESWLPKDRGVGNFSTGQELIREEVRIHLIWNKDTNATLMKVGNSGLLNSYDQMMDLARARKAEYDAAGKVNWPLMIAADGDVPWRDVIKVLDLAKEAGFPRIEFAAPEAQI
jgi:biopolymer transport protein ExbD